MGVAKIKSEQYKRKSQACYDAHVLSYTHTFLRFAIAVGLQLDDMHDLLAILLLKIYYDCLVETEIEACIGCWLCPISDERLIRFFLNLVSFFLEPASDGTWKL
jgi:hypothetical protein